MYDPENNFPPELIDQQIEQPDTRLPRGEATLVHDLQTMYDQEKSSAIERVWTRIAHYQDAASPQPEPLPLQVRRQESVRSFPVQQRDITPQKRASHALSLIAAALICAVLVGSLTLVLRLTQRATTSTGGQPGSTTTAGETGEDQGKVITSWSSTQPEMLDFRSLSWSPDSQFIAADSQDSVQIRDAITGKNKLTITPGGLSDAWSPDGHYIAIDGDIFDASNGKLVRHLLNSTVFASPTSASALSSTLPLSGGYGVFTVAWSPNSSMLAGALMGGSYGNKVVIWNVNTGKVLYTYLGQSTDTIGSLAWSPDGKYVASASFDGVVKVWNALTGKVIFHHNDNVRVEGLAWAHTGLKLAFLSDASTVQVWEVATNKKITSYSSPSVDTAPVWSPDDTEIATASGNSVNIWNTTTGIPIYTFTRYTGRVTALAWAPNGKYIVSGSVGYLQPPGSPTPTSRFGVYALVWIA